MQGVEFDGTDGVVSVLCGVGWYSECSECSVSSWMVQ